MTTVRLWVDVQYDEALATPEKVAKEVDYLLTWARYERGLLDELGELVVGQFVPESPEAELDEAARAADAGQ